jgi:hypothetical protein
MTQKHTPGPWTVSYETDISGIENDPANDCVGLVDVAHVYMRTVPGRHEANARLIAAAPELLEALKDLLETFESEIHCEYDGTSMLYEKLSYADGARAAIAKATNQPKE